MNKDWIADAIEQHCVDTKDLPKQLLNIYASKSTPTTPRKEPAISDNIDPVTARREAINSIRAAFTGASPVGIANAIDDLVRARIAESKCDCKCNAAILADQIAEPREPGYDHLWEQFVKETLFSNALAKALNDAGYDHLWDSTKEELTVTPKPKNVSDDPPDNYPGYVECTCDRPGPHYLSVCGPGSGLENQAGDLMG
jgi:hypothetical protein